jgi:hypothetical protein
LFYKDQSLRTQMQTPHISRIASLINWGINTAMGRFDASKPPVTQSPWLNIICAASNWIFTGLPALITVWHDPWRRYLTLGALVSSTMYHLAEVKGRLPGLPYLRNYAGPLIQVDRAFALASMANTMWRLYTYGIDWTAVAVGVTGVVCALISERTAGWPFVLSHGVWHNAAFYVVMRV